MYIVDARACNNVAPKPMRDGYCGSPFVHMVKDMHGFQFFFRHGELVFSLSVRCGCFQLYMDGIKAMDL